jgi:glycogen operon protein
MIQGGNPDRLGNHFDGEGVNFALYTSTAEAVEVCLFDPSGQQTQCHRLPDQRDGVWHGYLPGCQPGQRYGYRVHGQWAPEQGLRHNPSKLLIDPYARRLDGEFQWSGSVFDYDRSTYNDAGPLQTNLTDSSPAVPKSVVSGEPAPSAVSRPRIPWTEMVIYEANVRGYTMHHPQIPDHERGKFLGLSNRNILQHLKALGITAIELLPVHHFIDEAFLVGRGLTNFWGYNSINFFTPHSRYANLDAVAEFKEMVDAIHEAGIEVILDVVYNHTGEGDGQGPTLSFKGIDNLTYYRTEPGHPDRYVNDTGCGNTLNTDHPRVQALVLESLAYWHRDMGVDGFRFDLAPVLGRTTAGFDPHHELLHKINDAENLAGAKLIAEPWDPGPGGYQLGAFPPRWAEWNDRYRDALRRFWCAEPDMLSSLAKHLHGSSDIFESSGRSPQASINFITSHDGFTLRDLVSYEKRHNDANGENNRDGHAHNFSCNHGTEGDSDDVEISRLRRRQRLNFLASLLLSNGTPMLLAGDEFGNSQAGNNNAYAQDNDIGWLDWNGLEADPDFFRQVKNLIRLRRAIPHFQNEGFQHGNRLEPGHWQSIEWLSPEAERMKLQQWHNDRAMTLFMPGMALDGDDAGSTDAVALMFNAADTLVDFSLPLVQPGGTWKLVFSSAGQDVCLAADQTCSLPSRSMACAILGLD